MIKMGKHFGSLLGFMFFPGLSFAEGISEGTPEQQISVIWKWSESILTVVLFFTVLRTALGFYDHIKTPSHEGAERTRKLLVNWLKGVLFLVIAFALVNSMKIGFNSALSTMT